MSTSANAASGHQRRDVSTSRATTHRSNCGEYTLLVSRNQATTGVSNTHSCPTARRQPNATMATAPTANAAVAHRLRCSSPLVSSPSSSSTVHVAAKVPIRSDENV